MGTKRRASSRLTMWQGKRKQGQRRAKIWIPKEKTVFLAKMGEPEEGIGFKTKITSIVL